MSTIEIRLDKVDKTYAVGEKVKGNVIISTHHKSMSHGEIVIKASGSTSIQLNAQNNGLFETLYDGVEPLRLLSERVYVSTGGKVGAGKTKFPFELLIAPVKGMERLYDTYHGVYVKTVYELSINLTRGMLSAPLLCRQEFIVKVPSSEKYKSRPVEFKLEPDSLENVHKNSIERITPFHISGRFNRLNCPITDPITGEVTIDSSADAVHSIEVQLVRVESVAYKDGVAREATEVQNIQIAEGDVARGLPIPIYLVLPRLFVCPTMITSIYKVEFEVNLTIQFKEGYTVSENFPIHIYRN
mmetsp:Transcript_2052/g.2969  ORF Transcript_2052/g.2969 Transcript_2052/m.2969 type:complete len:300 (+) Transcript_2052:403-1302(+)